MWKRFGCLLIMVLLLRQHGLFAGKMFVQPASGFVPANCPFNVNVMIDTENLIVSTVDMKIFLHDMQFTVNEFNIFDGIFTSYTKPQKSVAREGVRKGNPTLYVMGSNHEFQGVRGEQVFGTLRVTPQPGVQEVDIEFYALPGVNGSDSGMPYMIDGTVHEGLTEVFDGKYTVDDTLPCRASAEQPLAFVPETTMTDTNSVQSRKENLQRNGTFARVRYQWKQFLDKLINFLV